MTKVGIEALKQTPGQVRLPRRALRDLPEPLPGLALPGLALSAQLAAMRADERY